MGLSLDLLRARGYYAIPVEEHVYRPGKTEKDDPLVYTKDLFGCIDLIGLKKGETIAVQTTSLSNISSRIAKVAASEGFEFMKLAGWKVQVHGWPRTGAPRIEDMSATPTDWAGIYRARQAKKARRKGKGRVLMQTDLGL